jgi:hypothetical protein
VRVVLHPAVADLGLRLQGLGWVTELFVGGSAATGDYTRSVSDLDRGAGAGLHLGCAYVQDALLPKADAMHPTWTHEALRHRILSGITRAELVRHGHAVFGRSPRDVQPGVSDDERAARRARRTRRVLEHAG